MFGAVLSFPIKEGDLVPGSPYRLVKRLGNGAFGQVWQAKHEVLLKSYALKFCLHPDAIVSLENEAKHLTRIQNALGSLEGFVRLHDLFCHAKYPFVAYEYVEAVDFGKFLQRRFKEEKHGPFSPFEAAEIVFALATIMVRIHTLPDPIVHRDLKPSNVLLLNDRPPWQFKVADFGIGAVAVSTMRARELTISDPGQSMSGIGTFCYMSSEQCDETHKPHPSDDVHALGVMWYELLRGEHRPVFRFSGPPSHDPEGFDWDDLRRRLARSGLTNEQAALVESCLSTHEDRPEHAGALAEEIRRLFPLIREGVLSDVAEIERLRMTGADWLGHIRKIVKKRLATWDEAIRHRIPEAHWLKGLCYQHGIGMDADLDKARVCFSWAVLAKCPNARCDLALLDIEVQRERSLKMLKQAADQDHAEAAFRLAEILSEGKAIDVLPFVDSGDTTALGAFCTWVESVENGKPLTHMVSVGEEGLLASLFSPIDPQAPESQTSAFYTVSTPSGRTWLVKGKQPSKILPLRLFLPHPISYLLELPPRVLELLDEYDLTTLQSVLSCTEVDYLRQRSEYALEEVRNALVTIWCDPWEACRLKAKEYLEKAQKLGHTGVKEKPGSIALTEEIDECRIRRKW